MKTQFDFTNDREAFNKGGIGCRDHVGSPGGGSEYWRFQKFSLKNDKSKIEQIIELSHFSLEFCRK